MTRLLRSAVRCVLAALTALAAAGLLLAGPLVLPASATASDTYEHDAMHYTNVERHDVDRVGLRYSSCLDRYAEAQARAMAKAHSLQHQDLGPILSGCHLSAVGENIAYGYRSGKSVVAGWMGSTGHRQNLLNSSYRLTGMGAIRDAHGHWWVSQVLGKAA